MKKISAILCTAIIAACTLTACSGSDGTAPAGFKEISNDGVTYNLYVPETWTEEPYISEGLTAARFGDQDSSNISVVAFEISSEDVTPIIPADTESDTDADTTAVTAAADSTLAESESERKLNESAFKAIENYWGNYEPTLMAVFPDFKYDSEPERVTLDGAEAIEYRYSGSMKMNPKDSQKYMFRQIVAIKDTRIYIFTYTATAENYDAHIEDVAAILDYFTFS